MPEDRLVGLSTVLAESPFNEARTGAGGSLPFCIVSFASGGFLNPILSHRFH